jgi:hypothetical protein
MKKGEKDRVSMLPASLKAISQSTRKDYTQGGGVREMTLPVTEFIRRFLLHVLLEGFVRIDPYFHFDCAHPFPGLKKVIMRLRNSGVAVSRLEVKPDTRFLASGATVYLNCSKDDEFWGVRYRVVIRDIKVPGEKVIVEAVRDAAVRAWLPLEASVPSGIPSLMEAKSLRELEVISSLWERRLKGMWFPAIPGILPSGFAESFAKYLAFRAAEEQWQTTIGHGRAATLHRPANALSRVIRR